MTHQFLVVKNTNFSIFYALVFDFFDLIFHSVIIRHIRTWVQVCISHGKNLLLQIIAQIKEKKTVCLTFCINNWLFDMWCWWQMKRTVHCTLISLCDFGCQLAVFYTFELQIDLLRCIQIVYACASMCLCILQTVYSVSKEAEKPSAFLHHKM